MSATEIAASQPAVAPTEDFSKYNPFSVLEHLRPQYEAALEAPVRDSRLIAHLKAQITANEAREKDYYRGYGSNPKINGLLLSGCSTVAGLAFGFWKNPIVTVATVGTALSDKVIDKLAWHFEWTASRREWTKAAVGTAITTAAVIKTAATIALVGGGGAGGVLLYGLQRGVRRFLTDQAQNRIWPGVGNQGEEYYPPASSMASAVGQINPSFH